MDRRLAIRAVAAMLLAYVASVRVNGQTTPKSDECIDGPSTWYTGTRDYTAKGTTCQRWDTQKPHKPKHVPKDGGHHNYCRNPDNDLRGTWCYTIDNNTRWEYCNISKCPDDSLVIWTNYDAASESTHLLRVQADPEIVKQETDSTGSFNVTVLTGSNRSMTEYWALAADYQRQRLYFTDYRSEYIGVWKMKEKKAERYFEGMAHGIECIAYDWKTNNLYWTDSEFKWVMVAEDTFSYYAPVYRTAPDPAYGLAVHSVKRLLIFSTYKALGSKIMVTDLAGKSPRILFKFPNVFDVTGITIDYTDDRIYWTDFTGYGGMVMSSLLDGTNKTQHHYRGGSIFWGVAAYLDYLYVSDVHARYSMTGSRFYSVWIITKRQKQVFRYTLSGKPRGVAVYSHNEEFSRDTPPTSGECDESEECAHICLPRINTTRACACSLGYHLETASNKCQPKLVKDDYLLVADAGQGKVFQIPITEKAENNSTLKYSIVPLGHKLKAVTVALDPSSKYLYWSDKKKSLVGRASVDGSRYSQVASSFANSIIVDPHTGNLFYSDNERDTIMVSLGDGTAARTIVKPDPGKTNTSSIRMITQDIKYKFIYWTDTFSKEGEGQVLRCRFDGSGKEVVLDKLNWPHAITIDYETNRLYVAEAKNAIIYEIELSSLVKINSTSVQQKHYKQYDVSPHITRISPYLIDLKIHKGMAYVVDGKSSRLERFNLTKGASSMVPYGPAEFFRVTTLSVFSETFYAQYIKPKKNPCLNEFCREMCVALSDTRKTCLCKDGRKAVGNICVPDVSGSDITPPIPENCPDDVEMALPSCASSIKYSWTAPTWKDDKTSPQDLVITTSGPSSPATLTAGRQMFSYTATDKSGNVGYCRFTVTVLDNQCKSIPDTRPGMVRTTPTCQNRVGSYFNVSCLIDGYVVWYTENGQSKTVSQYQVICSKDLKWISRMTQNSDCRPPPSSTKSSSSTTSAKVTVPTPATTVKTTQGTSTTSSTTTTATATSTTTSTPIITTTTATTRTTTTTTTTSTTPKTISTSATPTTTTAKSASAKATAKSSSTSTTSTATKKSVETTPETVLETTKGSPVTLGQAKGGSGLSSGAIAAIAILVIVLVVVIIVVVFVTVRRNSPSLLKYSFPQFWKSREDTIDLQTSDGNRYNVM